MKQRTTNAKTQTPEEPVQTSALSKPPGPTPEQIRRRAQEIFEARGSTPGHELDDWLQAETELNSGIGLRGDSAGRFDL